MFLFFACSICAIVSWLLASSRWGKTNPDFCCHYSLLYWMRNFSFLTVKFDLCDWCSSFPLFIYMNHYIMVEGYTCFGSWSGLIYDTMISGIGEEIFWIHQLPYKFMGKQRGWEGSSCWWGWVCWRRRNMYAWFSFPDVQNVVSVLITVWM